MDIRKLQRAIVDGLEDVKAQDIQVFNTEHLSPLFERVVVASGQSNRQTRALANSVRETVKARGLQVLRMEGEDNGEWIIVDCGAAVVHVMQPGIRQYYHLEEIWGDKPVRLKSAEAAAKSTQKAQKARRLTTEPAPAEAPAQRATRASAKADSGVAAPTGRTTRTGGTVAAKAPAKAAPRKAAAPQSAAKPAAKTARAPTVKATAKAAPSKAAPKAAAKTVVKPVAKKAAPAKAPARPAAKKAPVARKAAVKKAG
jgi:ribosome-associated protein